MHLESSKFHLSLPNCQFEATITTKSPFWNVLEMDIRIWGRICSSSTVYVQDHAKKNVKCLFQIHFPTQTWYKNPKSDTFPSYAALNFKQIRFMDVNDAHLFAFHYLRDSKRLLSTRHGLHHSIIGAFLAVSELVSDDHGPIWSLSTCSQKL